MDGTATAAEVFGEQSFWGRLPFLQPVLCEAPRAEPASPVPGPAPAPQPSPWSQLRLACHTRLPVRYPCHNNQSSREVLLLNPQHTFL